jgi:PAS domain S-box-containing protein
MPSKHNGQQALLAEIASLRARVAELEAESGEDYPRQIEFFQGSNGLPAMLDQATDPHQLRREQVLQATAIGVSCATGEEFFRLLVRHLANTLQCDLAVVGVLMPGQPNRVRTLAFFANREWQTNIEYELPGTPCENVVSQGACLYAAEVQARFPDDRWLVDWKVESYAGTPLFGSRGQVLGLISVMGCTPIQATDAVRSALQIFGVRAAAEVERQQTEDTLLASQRALAESEERFRQIAENVRDMFWLYDVARQELLYVSPAYETIWGRPREWLFEDHRRWPETVHPDDRERAVRLHDPQSAGKVYDEVYRVIRPGGEMCWVHDRRFAVFNAAGVYYRLVGICEDITQRHETADKLDQHGARLAHMERLSTVGQLVASIAHEVNQPLYAIANFSSAISTAIRKSGPEAMPQVQSWNEEITKSAMRAGEIIRRIRAYVSRGPTPRTDVDLNAVVEESVALLAAEARRQRVAIRLELTRPLPLLSADPIALQQVIVNLVRNSIEAVVDSRQGERYVRVLTRAAQEGLEVAVEDTGAGLNLDAMDRLFAAFYTSKPQGMGMGLAISKTIVEAHHGRIWATPNAGGGSTFHFLLPLNTPDRADA